MDEELAECLLMWVQTFSVDGDKDSVQALSDGVALCYILREVSPSFFDEDWVNGINKDSVDNKHLKISNLKKILKGIITFYENEVSFRIQESKKPNLKMIVENNNLLEMGRLLQLVLGCAVNCDNKQDYIEAIMGMEESVQHGVMTAIQELLIQDGGNRLSESESDISEKLHTTLRENEEQKERIAELSERCRELDHQVAMLQEERTNQDHTETAAEKTVSIEDLEDPNTAAGKKYIALQEQLEQYKDEVYRLDAAKEDYRVKYEIVTKDHEDLRLKNESLTSLAEEARTLKDEVDVLRQNEERIKLFENTIEAYKRKLEEMSDLKRQVRMLEEQNTSYMEKSVEWEDEAKKSSALKSQIEVYKRQVQELQTKVSTETKRADKADFEVKRSQDKLASIQKENDRIRSEMTSLKETHEELQFSQLSLQTGEPGDANSVDPFGSSALSLASELKVLEPEAPKVGSRDDDLELLSLPPALKERFIRLQTENKVINKKLQEMGDTTTIKSMLEDAEGRVAELESETRIGNQRVMELEAQVEDLQEASSNAKAGDGEAATEFRKKLLEQSNKLKALESEVEKKRQYIETADSRIMEFTDTVREKDEKLQQRENEMKEIEEKYKKYLEKAKSVINKFENSQAADLANSPQIEKLRGQLAEKELMVSQIKAESDKQKQIKDQEEKLMVSAWYNMGMNMHRKAVEDRLSTYSTGQSFLSRQRQVHNRKAGTPLSSSNR